MALGMSGSNGGVSDYRKIDYLELEYLLKYSNSFSDENLSKQKGLMKKLN